jgi:hypothetical protein
VAHLVVSGWLRSAAFDRDFTLVNGVFRRFGTFIADD